MTNKTLHFSLVLFLISIIGFAQQGKTSYEEDDLTYRKIEVVNKTKGNILLKGVEGTQPEQSVKTNNSGIGETVGMLSVSPTGSAMYDIPIAVPPGINGVTPTISLSYNSQSGNGMAGFGWNIKGVSVITRIPSTRYHDGQLGEVASATLNRFSIDGNRLLLKSGVYGEDGSEYETENYSNLKISYHKSSDVFYFMVHYPDGSFAKYGKIAIGTVNSDAASRTTYAIKYWENPQGVRVDYTYLKDHGAQYIKEILYGHVNSGTPINKIEFNYGSPTRRTIAYFHDTRIEKRKTLTGIKVYANNLYYRAYSLTHSGNSTRRFTRLARVQEHSYDGSQYHAHTPIEFNYTNTTSSVNFDEIETSLGLSSIDQNNSRAVPLDLTGNGKMDFLVIPKNVKNKFHVFKNLQSNNYNTPIEVTGSFEDVFPVSWINSNNKVVEGQGIAVVKNVTESQVKFNVYSNSNTNGIQYQYTKSWNAPTYTYQNNANSSVTKRIDKDYISGDFNGDGLTDVLAIGKPYTSRSCYEYACRETGTNKNNSEPITRLPNESDSNFESRKKTAESNVQSRIPDPNDPGDPYDPNDPDGNGTCYSCNTIRVDHKAVYFIDLKQDISTGFVDPVGSLLTSIEPNHGIQTGDFNGDGKTDIIHLTEDTMYVYSLNNNNNLTLLWQTATLGNGKLIFGDYNGDGKTDILAATAHQSYDFHVFISTGTRFVSQLKTMPFKYRDPIWSTIPSNVDTNNHRLRVYNLIPLDVNGDGITDIVDYYSRTYNDSNTEAIQYMKIYNNIGIRNSVAQGPFAIEFKEAGEVTKTGNVEHYPIPVFLSSDEPNKNLELATISDRWVTNFSFTKDHREDVLLRSIENNGVTHNITYDNLDPEAQMSSTDFTPVYTPASNAIYPNVDIQVGLGTKVVKTLERTCTGAVPLQRKFFYQGGVYNLEGLGFLGFKGLASTNWHTSTSDAIYSVSKYNTDLRGALTETYSQVGYANFNTPTSGYIFKTTYQTSHSLSSNKVFKLWVDSVLHQNDLEGTFVNSTYQYDAYNNPTQINKTFFGGSSTQNITYSNSLGTNYYIGRVVSEVKNTSVGNETFSSETQLTYTGYLLTQRKLKGNNTPFDVENYEYDTFGNITKKTIIPNGETAREINFEYDSTGRFLIKSINLEGLETVYQYNTDRGVLISETNLYGQQTTYEYDSWNRAIKITDYLGNEASTTYVETNNAYTITNSADNGTEAISVYDPLERLVTAKQKDVLGQWVSTSYEYDKFDRPYKVSEPYIGNAPTQWNETEFDVYGRPTKQTLYTGREINISYNGLTTTVDDSVKTVTTTSDGLGNVLSSTDPGGTINYSYYGNGNLKSSNYDGVIVSVEQDGWGRKTKLTDPSAGTYQYTYNGFGEITKETTPKGETNYTYSAIGKLQQEIVTGDDTNMTIQYSYNPVDKLLSTIALTGAGGNNATYSYNYDAYKRVLNTTETNAYAEFSKAYTYDAFGRVATEQYDATLLSNNKTSSKKVKNAYQNGVLKTIQDFNTNATIWEVTAVNARGQLTTATMGNNITANNTYDAYGYLTENTISKNTNSTPQVVMQLTTDFNAQRGTLNSRTNSMFSWSETFGYDNLDRLISFNDNNGDNSNVYDTKGRIIKNNAIGDYNYTGNSYQVNDVALNNQGDLYYQQNHLQQVTYNAFKKPVTINEEGKERIDFLYNAFKGRSHRFYGGTEADITQRNNSKHYSADGSMEISFDEADQETLFVTYIGGDAYSSPIIWRSEQKFIPTEGYYYLHRDYLGSIMLITDADGEAKEKRHFDAWGNIVKVTNGNGDTLEKLTFLDRGYTGHEHLNGVNLIHMNGRLYDAKLRRFLAPDNYIQNPYNTQNYNRYGYVLNNPLLYVDPSGESSEDPGGLSGWQQSTIGSIIGSLFSTDWGAAGEWFSSNIKSGVEGISDGVRNAFRGVRNFLFGSKKDNIQVLNNPTNLNSDPLAGTSANSSAASFGGGGTENGNVGISWIDRQLSRLDRAIVGYQVGFYMGAKSSWDFVKSLTTRQGWKDLGQGFVSLYHLGNATSPQGVYMRAQLAQSASDFITRIPEMSAQELGYYAGFSGEKVVEAIIGSKGAGLFTNFVKGTSSVTNLSKVSKSTTALTSYWPSNGGALGKWGTKHLMPGTEIDRFGSGFGKYFSPRNTPMPMRALPGGNTAAYNAYKVVKPFSVQYSTIAPAFGQPGLGIQYLSPVNANTLLKRGIIVPL